MSIVQLTGEIVERLPSDTSVGKLHLSLPKPAQRIGRFMYGFRRVGYLDTVYVNQAVYGCSRHYGVVMP